MVLAYIIDVCVLHVHQWHVLYGWKVFCFNEILVKREYHITGNSCERNHSRVSNFAGHSRTFSSRSSHENRLKLLSFVNIFLLTR